MSKNSSPVSVRQAQTQTDLVVQSITVAGATVELCAFPELLAETLLITESESVLSLGLSQLLAQAEGRFASAQVPRFSRFGSLNFRPAGVPFEVRVSSGSYHTIRCRLHPSKLLATGINPDTLSAAQLEACFDIHAPRIEDTMMRLAEEVNDQAADSTAMVDALVTSIALDLARYLFDAERGNHSHRGGLAPRHLRLVFSRIDEPGPPPSVQQLADLCGLSRYHFMRAFKESVGESPGAYTQKMLMTRARNLLSASDRPISSIANLLGYNNTAAFSSAFRRHSGRSPRAWRACLR